MKRLRSILSLSVIVSLLIPFLAFAHSGRTDANGGHYNRKTGEYHYHGGGPARAADPAKSLDSQSGSRSAPSGTSSGSKVQEQGNGKTDQVETTVYVTKTGAKYHSAGCSYLRKSSIPMKLSEASQRYTPCSRCNPPKVGKQ